MTRVVTMNERDTIAPGDAGDDLRRVLKEYDPDIAFLQEWGSSRDGVTQKVCDELGYAWTRPDKGGGPVLWRKDRYRLRACHAIRLARREFVGHLPGRRSRLGANYATEVILEPLNDPYRHPGDNQTAALGAHFTAEVQDVRGGGGYKRDPLHVLRVLRHRREKHRLGRRMRVNKRKGREVYSGLDSNFSGMTIGGFVNCWDGHDGGSLQGRPVDIIYSDGPPKRAPQVMKTRSDHRAVCVTY